MNNNKLTLVALLLFSLLATSTVYAKDYLVTAARPNLVMKIDAGNREVMHTCEIPNTSMGNSPGALTASQDGRFVYVIHNSWETVSGIEFSTCKEIFRAELSSSGIRAKAPYAIDLNSDGTELAVYVNPTLIKSSEYEVLDPYIAIYTTTSGIDAQPVRKLNQVPRRVSSIFYSTDSSKLYAFSWDMLVLDPNTGEQIGKHPWRSWSREGFGEPDTLAIWPQFEQSQEFATPYYISHLDENGNESLKAGVWALDLENDTVRFTEFEEASVVLFSSVINPVRKNEAYTVYTQLTKTNMDTGEIMKRIDLDHTYYNVNISTDGAELYVGGTVDDIAVYDSVTLEKIDKIMIPGGGDQVLTSLRVVNN